MKRNRILLLVLLFLFVSCVEEEVGRGTLVYEYSQYFFTEFVIPSYSFLSEINEAKDHSGNPCKCYAMDFGGDKEGGKECSEGGKNVELFDSLSAKYGTQNYNGKLWTGNHRVLGEEIASIDIISNSDYDSSHKAGDLLNDVVMLSANVFSEYIKSGYSDKVSVRRYKNLSEYTKEDFILINSMYFYFPTPPILSKHHTFTFTVTFENGKVLTAKQEVEF